MDAQHTRDYLLGKPEAWEDYPFGPGPAVFKIRQKMFALLITDKNGARLNLKCDPVQAQMLRDLFEAVRPGYHMNKRHWNTVLLDGSLPDGEVQRMIDHSYGLVVLGLKVVERKALELAWGVEELYR
ncbi:MmcQ/YjbR family DNA-binding protein [Marinobacterium sedimentorum]|uniref:MmcQ/YjbR family DNA-binding protein n=1 Tax=Marinobacterium sedimentorum TaxID=2927804 RepID=UPI0020C728B9|nr:MmcQ/YjbR family DNA-binding protein [Marinobacterium sedimentorum]MCP8686685.1 MmcQ/YjbR family DNA-binding protein [Marinobacterium sedimentorum]